MKNRLNKKSKSLRVKLDNATDVLPSAELSLLFALVRQAGIEDEPKEEFKFLDDRDFRFDVAWPRLKVAFEREGGKFIKVNCPSCNHEQTRFVSRHHNKDGLEKDAEKYNLASIDGWRVIRATPPMIKSGRAADHVIWALKAAVAR